MGSTGRWLRRHDAGRPDEFLRSGGRRDGVEILGDFVNVGEAVFRTRIGGAADDGVEAGIARHDARSRLGIIAGQATGEQFMENHADREDVRTMIHGLGSVDDFGRSVLGSAENFPAPRDFPSDRVGETKVADFWLGVDV